MIKFTTSPALIIVDVQKGFDNPAWGQRNNPEAEQQIIRLLEAWRMWGYPIFHVQHLSREADSPLRPDAAGSALKEEVKPSVGEPLIQKHVNSAFIGTDLESRLQEQEIDTVVIVGLTTDHCVSTTARMAGNLGFETYVLEDATATFERVDPWDTYHSAEQMHVVALTSLNAEFATIVSTDEVLEAIDLMNE